MTPKKKEVGRILPELTRLRLKTGDSVSSGPGSVDWTVPGLLCVMTAAKRLGCSPSSRAADLTSPLAALQLGRFVPVHHGPAMQEPCLPTSTRPSCLTCWVTVMTL